MPAIAHFDALLSSHTINPNHLGERRSEVIEVVYKDFPVTINAHLKIPDRMIDTACTQEQFRAYLDRHVFCWPTLRDCRKMMDSYTRKEPNEAFAVLEFDAYSLLLAHDSAVKLSKYDSGSSPRFPSRCSYRKSVEMFVTLDDFRSLINNTVPTKTSEIHEILIEDRVMNVSKYLRAVYTDDDQEVPERWKGLRKPATELS
ncbi:hypothetical protein NNL21_16270 [Paenibacillus mendelii]|nr:hypothetical protein [Paenibacillus mendelii]MCQ6560248.1 hypothetical protein [Paenibacillus mendelii]